MDFIFSTPMKIQDYVIFLFSLEVHTWTFSVLPDYTKRFTSSVMLSGHKRTQLPRGVFENKVLPLSLQSLRRIPFLCKLSFHQESEFSLLSPAGHCSTNDSLLRVANLCLYVGYYPHKSSSLYLLSSLRLSLIPLFIYSKLTDSSKPNSIVSFLWCTQEQTTDLVLSTYDFGITGLQFWFSYRLCI